jgi:hypothetical protein
MSKGRGKKIAIKFDKPLLGDVTGKMPPLGSQLVSPVGLATASSQYSSYAPDRAFDGSTSSYWYTRTTGDQWCQIELPEAVATNGFRWYIGSSYRPNGFTVQGSNDGETWDTIYTGNSDNATGWKDFSWDWTQPYKYYRWTVTSRYSTYLRIYEIELSVPIGNERAFSVTGLEKSPLFYGEPTLREYPVERVERYPDTTDTIILTMTESGLFRDTEGDLTVAYNQALGNLAGVRPVESFEVSFAPSDLEPTPVHEHTITVRGEPVVQLIPVSYHEYPDHARHAVAVTAGPISVAFIHVDDVPP